MPPQPPLPASHPSLIPGLVHLAGNRYTFAGITTLPQTWAWLQGPLQETLFPTKPFYAGGTANYSEVASHLVLGQLALVGAVRIKQWRVRPGKSRKGRRRPKYKCVRPLRRVRRRLAWRAHGNAWPRPAVVCSNRMCSPG